MSLCLSSRLLGVGLLWGAIAMGATPTRVAAQDETPEKSPGAENSAALADAQATFDQVVVSGKMA